MIKASELRIGNFVTVDNEKYHPKLKNIPLQVTGMSLTTGLDDEPTYSITLNHPKEEPNSYNETYSQFIKFIQPIALTPEILEKAGFVSGDGRTYAKEHEKFISYELSWNKLSKSVHAFGIATIASNGTRNGVQNFSWSVKFVHQLQNLYHSLTGEELQINFNEATQKR